MTIWFAFLAALSAFATAIMLGAFDNPHVRNPVPAIITYATVTVASLAMVVALEMGWVQP